MKRPARLLLLAIPTMVVFLLSAPVAFAHVPQLLERGATLETATMVDDPATSWVYYGTTQSPEEVWYYRLDLRAGDRLYVQILTPGHDGFCPSFAVMGPGLTPKGELPDFVDTPTGAPGADLAAVVNEGDLGEAEYEAFTPGAYHYPAVMDIPAPQDGTYYVGVYDEELAGPFGLAIGYEEKWTLPGWIRLPADLISIYAWDRGWAVALAPGIAVLVIGAGLILRRARAGTRAPRNKRSLSGWLALAAGLFCLTTSGIVITQMLLAAVRSGFDPMMALTGFFIAAPAVLGALLVWLGWRAHGVPTVGTRILLLILALAGLGFWAGYFVGPVLAIAAAAAPPYAREELKGSGASA
jgi:hypothetical protein